MFPLQKTIRDECEDEEMKQMFISKKEDNTILSCEQTVTKLLSLLESGTYTSGDHVDYYDIPDKAGHENWLFLLLLPDSGDTQL